jgi:hypothetical protein
LRWIVGGKNLKDENPNEEDEEKKQVFSRRHPPVSPLP